MWEETIMLGTECRGTVGLMPSDCNSVKVEGGGEVTQWIRRINTENEKLAKTLLVLRDRLKPILGLRPASPKQDEACPELCPLATKLRANRNFIQCVNDDLCDIIGEIEI